jgi:hypothetical protein
MPVSVGANSIPATRGLWVEFKLPVAGLGEGEPLVAEVGDDLQAPAEGFDVGGQGPEFCRAGQPGGPMLVAGDSLLFTGRSWVSDQWFDLHRRVAVREFAVQCR